MAAKIDAAFHVAVRQYLDKPAADLRALLVSKDQQIAELEQRLAIEPVTGLLNKPAFMARLQREMDRRSMRDRNAGLPICVLYLDADGLKKVNDTAGHAAGDKLIAAVVKAMVGATRPNDEVARMGGDEFAILLRDAALSAAYSAKRRINTLLSVQTIDQVDGSPHVSIGVAMWNPNHDGTMSANALVDLADTRMLDEKQTRRTA